MVGRHVKALFLLGIIGLAVFSNGLHGQFMVDDHAFFEEKLRNIKFLPLHFLPDKDRALHIEAESADPFYRPLATIVPMLSWLAFKENTFGHHALNLLLFVLAGWAIYLFFFSLGVGWLWALLAAAFYIIHPINGVMVNYITASIFSVQVILMLFSLYGMRRWAILPRSSKSMAWLFAAMFSYVLAMMCHETAMALPFYALALLVITDDNRQWYPRLARGVRVTWPLFALLTGYFIWHMRFASLHASILGNIQYYHIDFFQYLATWTMLLCWYLSRLFWPQNIVLIMAHQPLKDHTIAWLLVLVLLWALLIYLLKVYRRDKFMLLGLVWFVLGLAPFTLACFFQVIHGLMIEPHWFAFPVVGFFLFAAGVFVRFEQGPRRWLGRTAMAIILLTCFFFSQQQNWLWADEVRYCKFWMRQSPSFAAVDMYIAKAYELRRDFKAARFFYQRTLGQGYKEYIAYGNMGLMDMREGKWEQAEQNLKKAYQLDPHSSITAVDLGVIEFKKANYEKALEWFKKGRALNRFEILAYLDISKTQLKLGHNQEAIDILEEALAIEPDNDTALTDLIQIYIALKDKENTVLTARRIARLSRNPNSVRNARVLLKFYGYGDEK